MGKVVLKWVLTNEYNFNMEIGGRGVLERKTGMSKTVEAGKQIYLGW